MIVFVLKIIVFVKHISAGQKIKNDNDSDIIKVLTNPHNNDEIDEYFGDLIDFDFEIDHKADIEEALLEFLESELRMEESDDEQYRPGDKKMNIFDEKLKEKRDETNILDINNNNKADDFEQDRFTTEELQNDNTKE
ncbi:hypothetical protein NBO_76g0023 [Nosema bombycis CQ1]|uniref:Uncharacterized protein n=1 Tax=Nosema bombycis (strain CQ1 / CVCC 102059) TaxID=578461 RepID=R0MKW5_NOSB1|nr:hypothetical protein NBO_76g0023 [Nosema bombycis CQ1]|eukprot:EOB13418.1 hypothetical protein NBO_76g0023 [Nosema bombycis CQ1]